MKTLLAVVAASVVCLVAPPSAVSAVQLGGSHGDDNQLGGSHGDDRTHPNAAAHQPPCHPHQHRRCQPSHQAPAH